MWLLKNKQHLRSTCLFNSCNSTGRAKHKEGGFTFYARRSPSASGFVGIRSVPFAKMTCAHRIASRLEAIACKLQVIAIRLEAISVRLEAAACRLDRRCWVGGHRY